MADLRLFIAARPPDTVLRGLSDLSRLLASRGDGVKWVRSDSIHLTLKFLGSVDEAMAGAIGDAAARCARGVGNIPLSVGRVGAFPDMRRPRVIWVGLAGEIERLGSVANALEEACFDLGFSKEGRAFRPHLTLGRVKDRLSVETIKKIEQSKDVVLGDMVVDAIELIKSDLLPSGAVYTTLSHFPLT
ncbi:MAG: RNA 2',3'-cyclic phosphodiesterase [Deltaproteobacteria bacterium]|nr:RNA 2',3'-cyclic phosphodiesterase [Candidatus Zymogenaceae bacterium]